MIDFVKEAQALFPYTQSMRRDFRFPWRGAGARHSFDSRRGNGCVKK